MRDAPTRETWSRDTQNDPRDRSPPSRQDLSLGDRSMPDRSRRLNPDFSAEAVPSRRPGLPAVPMPLGRAPEPRAPRYAPDDTRWRRGLARAGTGSDLQKTHNIVSGERDPASAE